MTETMKEKSPLLDLEAVKGRAAAAACHRAVTVMAGRELSPAVLSAEDVPELVAEIEKIRQHVALGYVADEVPSLRESVRSELIVIGAAASATVDAIRALHTPMHPAMIGPYCTHCTSPIDGGPEMWPCATVKLLEPAGEEAL